MFESQKKSPYHKNKCHPELVERLIRCNFIAFRQAQCDTNKKLIYDIASFCCYSCYILNALSIYSII